MSTAPYLKTLIPKDLESERLHNAISAIRQISNIPISVDTVRSDVIRSVLKLEVNAINDVTGLKYDKKMPSLASEQDLPVILGAYLSDRENLYGDGDIQDTSSLLAESIRIAKKCKIDDDKLIIDRWRDAPDPGWEWKGHTSSDEICSQTFAHAVMWEFVATNAAAPPQRYARTSFLYATRCG